MPSYLVETYLSGTGAADRAACEHRARSAADELTRSSQRVRFAGAIHIPADEVCFFLFDAPSSDVAALVAQHARLDPIRVVEAVVREEQRSHRVEHAGPPVSPARRTSPKEEA